MISFQNGATFRDLFTGKWLKRRQKRYEKRTVGTWLLLMVIMSVIQLYPKSWISTLRKAAGVIIPTLFPIIKLPGQIKTPNTCLFLCGQDRSAINT